MAELDLRGALSAALANDSTESPEGTAENAETPDLAEGATSETVETAGSGQAATEGKETEGAEGAEGTTSEDSGALEVTEDSVPTEYFGTDLSGLPAKERAEIIAGFTNRDRHIQQLLREKAGSKTPEGEKLESRVEEPPAGDDGGEVTGADILSALGLDPARAEDPDDDTKAIIGLGRFALSLQEKVAGIESKSLVSETKQLWESTLSAMEEQYGKLPADITRADVYKLAVENGISEPVDAYWRIMGPARHDILAEVTKRREAATKLVATQQQPQKPTSATKTEDANPLEGVKDTRSAIQKALASLKEEKGWDLEDPALFDEV